MYPSSAKALGRVVDRVCRARVVLARLRTAARVVVHDDCSGRSREHRHLEQLLRRRRDVVCWPDAGLVDRADAIGGVQGDRDQKLAVSVDQVLAQLGYVSRSGDPDPLSRIVVLAPNERRPDEQPLVTAVEVRFRLPHDSRATPRLCPGAVRRVSALLVRMRTQLVDEQFRPGELVAGCVEDSVGARSCRCGLDHAGMLHPFPGVRTPHGDKACAGERAWVRCGHVAVRSVPAKTTTLKVRLDPVQKRAFVAAARREGLDVSAWIRRVANAEVARVSRGGSRRQ